jgi:hypothetical protein
MTAKEKAKDLVDRYLNIEFCLLTDNQAKQCALICIDKMIETLLPYGGILYVKEEVEELEEVKQEINRL